MEFKAGFISIIGRPNVGKSTLLNAIIGQKLAIVTAKAQTTRHRIFGIETGDHYQMVFSDTPGIIDPAYKMQEAMMKFVKTSLEDADLLILLTDFKSKLPEERILNTLMAADAPLMVVLNKADGKTEEEIEARMAELKQLVTGDHFMAVSAKYNQHVDQLKAWLITHLPEHPPYFAPDELTDKTERFIASEVIREQIFLQYDKEIPYATEVAVTSFKNEENILRISAEIYTERPTQRSIIIGKGGSSIKNVGIEARKQLEEFFGKKVFLETHVKVEKDWRKKSQHLRRFGFEQ